MLFVGTILKAHMNKYSFRNEAPWGCSTSLQSVHTLLQCASEPTFAYIFMSCVWVRLPLHGTHTAALVAHLHFTHLNNCQLCVTLNFHLHSFGSSCLTGNGGSADQTTPHTCSPKCTVIHGNMHLLWQQSVVCPLPFCVCSAGPCRGLFLLLAKPHGFPAFHHSPSLVGNRANSPRWRGSALELQKSSGLERRPEFPPSLGCPWPHPILPSESLQAIWEVSQFIHRAVCAALTWSQPSQTPPGTRPLPDRPPKPQRLGSPDTKHDPVMSYKSVCVCIIQTNGWSYVTMQCKLTVLACRRSDGLQLTSILKLSVYAGTLYCERVQLPLK